MKHQLALAILIFLSLISCNQSSETITNNPNPEKNGYVFNSETAVKIAEAVWLPIYGERIYSEKPFHAELRDTVWIVKGTVHAKLGGTVYIKINKRDGRILMVTHYQ
jgi:hypothetical protein